MFDTMQRDRAPRRRYVPGARDREMWGEGLQAAVDEAFAQTGVDPSEFVTTRTIRDTDGGVRPIEWRVLDGPSEGAYVAIDPGHGSGGPPLPHINFAGPGNQERGHIFTDAVPEGMHRPRSRDDSIAPIP